LPERVDPKTDPQTKPDAEVDRKRIAFWESEFARAETKKAPRTAIITECRRHYRGEHHGANSKQARPGGGDQDGKRPLVAIDQIFSTTEQCVALMTDQRPGVAAYPREQAAMERCELVSARLDYDQDQAGLQTKAPLIARTMFIEGLALARPSWDFAKDWPYGGPDLSVIPWENGFFDPDGRDWHNLSDYRWIGEKEWMPLWRIRSECPVTSRGMEGDKPGGPWQRVTQAATTILDRITGHEGEGAEGEKGGPGAYVYRVWHADVPEGEEIADWTPPTTPDGLKRPISKRYLVFTAERILEDKPWGPDFPHACFANYIGTDPDRDYWPMGDVEFLISPNRILNVLASRGKAWAMMVPRSTVIYNVDAVNKKDISNLEAIQIGVTGEDFDRVIKWVPGADLSPGFFSLWEMMVSVFEQTSGIREVLMGRAPEAGNSGVAFERLQTFALARIREKMTNFNAGLIRIGYRLLEIDARHVLQPRPLRVKGQTQVAGLDGTTMKTMPFAFATVGPELYYLPLRPGDTLQPDPETNIVMSVPSPEVVAMFAEAMTPEAMAADPGMEPPKAEPAPTISYEIQLEATSLAGSRQEKREDMKALVELGGALGQPLVDAEAVYDAFDFAGGASIQQRIQQAQMAQQAAMAQQEAVVAANAAKTEGRAADAAHGRQLQRDGAQIEGRLAQSAVRGMGRGGQAARPARGRGTA